MARLGRSAPQQPRILRVPPAPPAAPSTVTAGATSTPAGTHAGQSAPPPPGSYASGAGWASPGFFSPGYPGDPSPAGPVAGSSVRASGGKNVTGTAVIAGGGVAGGTGSVAAADAITAGATATAAGAKHATGGAAITSGLSAAGTGLHGGRGGGAAPGGAVVTPAAAKGARGLAPATGGGGATAAGTHSAQAGTSLPAGGTTTPVGVPGGPSSLPEGLAIMTGGRKTALGSAVITSAATSAGHGSKNTTGTASTPAGGTARPAGIHQGQYAPVTPGDATAVPGQASPGAASPGFPGDPLPPSPAGPQATAAILPVGNPAATGTAVIAGGGAVFVPATPGSAATLPGGAAVTAAGQKNAAGGAKVTGGGTSAAAASKNTTGASASPAGAKTATAGTHTARGAAVSPAGGTVAPAGNPAATGSAVIAAGAGMRSPGTPGTAAAMAAAAAQAPTGFKAVSGRATIRGGATSTGTGAKNTTGRGGASAGAAPRPVTAKGAIGPAAMPAGSRVQDTGTKVTTGSAATAAGAVSQTRTGTGTAASIPAGAASKPTGRKAVSGSAVIRGAAPQLPRSAKGGRGSARALAGGSAGPGGTHAAASAATVRGAAKTAPAARKDTTGSSRSAGDFPSYPVALGVQLVSTWTAAYTAPVQPGGVPLPGPATIPVEVANSPGNWLFAVVAWRQAAGYPPVTFHVGDGTNHWEPMGAPGGTSPGSGTLRVAVWRAPAARAVTAVCAAPTGYVVSAAVTVLEMSGLFPWITEAGTVTAYAAGVTSLPTLTPPVPATPVLWLSASVRSLSTPTGTYPGGHWVPGPAAATGNGLDHTGDLVILTAFQQATGGVSADWSQDTASDMAGIVAGVEIFAPQPQQPNPGWAPAWFEIAPGAGALTPADELAWVPLDGTPVGGLTVPVRVSDLSFTSGQQYTVGALQSGQGSVDIDNRDLAITPPGLGVFEGIDSGTPWRLRSVWPGGGAYPVNPTPHYVLTGTTTDLPSTWTTTRRGVVRAGLTDAWAACQPQIQSSLRQEILADGPVHLWPCGDTAGSVYASNIAPGSAAALALVTSKYGASGATAAFGTATALSTAQAAVAPGSGAGGLPGDGGTVWAQTGLPSAPTPGGYCLYCQSSDFPALSGTSGYTQECWSALTDAVLQQNGTLWALKGSKGLVMRCWADHGGALWLTTQDIAGSQDTTALGTGVYAAAGMFQTAVTWLAGVGWTAYVNGVPVAQSGSPPNLAPSYAWVSAGGESDRFTSGAAFDGQTAFLTDFPQALTPSRIAAHWQAGATAFQAETDSGRIERLLWYAGYTSRRVIRRATPADLVVSLVNLGSTASFDASKGGAPTPAGQGTVQAGQEMTALAASLTPAMLTVASTGDIVYKPKGAAFGERALWVLGEDTGAGEVPYTEDVNFTWDPQRVLNFTQITQVDRQDTVTPQAFTASAPGYLTPAQSQTRYGQQTYQINGYLYNDLTTPISSANPSNLLDLANWVTVTLAAPHLRAGKVTVDAATYPAAWPLVLGAQPGDVALVGRRPVTASASISVLARIMRIERQVTFKRGGAVATAVLSLDYAPEVSPLTLDDPVLGQIGVPVLGQQGTAACLTW